MTDLPAHTILLITEDDPGHARLIEKNLERAGIHNRRFRFPHGQAVLDFLFRRGPGPHREEETAYLLLLDIRMPQVDGIEVLSRLKKDPVLKSIPVIMLTTTEDPGEVARCHELGCNNYIVKPVDYESFAKAIQNLGLFINLVRVPVVSETDET